ncbi:hypothetical protein AB1484_08050 [Parafrankia sp. FMc6]|uniref:hypothetical protein n=1 Tax=Parafrankia soli TaxID=2599596 RepID=UPI0034D6FBFA
MTVDGTDRPTGGRRDDDFFAVERVGEPDDTAVSRSAPAADGGWDVTPWPASDLDVSAGSGPARGVVGGPLVDGPVLGGPAVGGPTVGGGPSVGDDPFDVSSTWNGPAPVIGGPPSDLGRAAPDVQPAPHSPAPHSSGPYSPGPHTPAPHPAAPHTPVPPASAPQVGLPPAGPSVTGGFRVPTGYESAPPASPRSYVEPTPPPRFPTERGSAPPGRAGGPDTGSVRIGGPDTGSAPGWGPASPGAGAPGINPVTGSFPLPPTSRTQPPAARSGGAPGPSAYQGYDPARPQSTPPPPQSGAGHPGGSGLPRPDQTGGFPRPDQTGGFARPGAAYPSRPGEPERPAPRPVDPWNGHSTGSGPRPDLSLPPRAGTPSTDRGRDDQRRNGYDSQGRSGYEVRPDQSRGDHGAARAPDGYGASGPTTGGYRVGDPGSGPAPLGGAGSPGGPSSPGGPGALGGMSAPGGGATPGAAAPGRPVGAGPVARAALPPGSWSGSPSGALPIDGRLNSGRHAADRPGSPNGDASGPWRSPHRDDPAAFPPDRPRGAGLPPLANDPLSGPLPVAALPPGRPEPGRPGGRPELGRPELGQPELGRPELSRAEPGGRTGPAGAARAEPLAPGTAPSGPWRSPSPRAAVEDTMTTTRSPFRGSGALPALPPGRSAAPGAPGADQAPVPGTPPPAPGAGTGPRTATGARGATGPRALPGPAAAGAAPGRPRRPESAAEMTSLVTRRGRAGAAGAADRGDDSGWQPSRGARRTGARGVPADRRRTPNPTTDTNSLQAVSAPPARRTTPRPADAPEDTGSTGRSSRSRADRPGRGGTDVEDLHPENRRSAARGAGLAGSGGGGGARGNGGGAGGRGGRGRGAGDDRPSTRAVGVLEPAEVDDEADDQPSTPDRLAWLKEGWIGPLAIALVVSLFVVGAYTLLTGDGGDKPPTEPTVTQSEPPTPTNPEALAGKALVNGTWRCRIMVVEGGDTRTGDLLPDKLVVDPTGLTYRWNDGQGVYTITPKQGDAAAAVIAEVQFTSGPLQGVTGKSLTTAKENSGIASGTLLLDAMPNVSARSCFVN